MPKQLKKNKFLSTKANLVLTIFITTIVVVLLILILYKQGFLSKQASSEPSFLYVQSAHSGTLSVPKADGTQTLTLNDVSPVTVFFSERPDRETGHQPTAEFINEWSVGEDSFENNPPNAALDIIGENSQNISIIELMKAKYDVQNKTLEYEVIVLDNESNGTSPEIFNEAVLFIDSTHVDYTCACEPSTGEDTCNCTYTYKLGASKTKEFRGHCGNDLYPYAIHIGGKRNSTSCTAGFPWFNYFSRSCTNWDAFSSDTLDVAVRCSIK